MLASVCKEQEQFGLRAYVALKQHLTDCKAKLAVTRLPRNENRLSFRSQPFRNGRNEGGLAGPVHSFEGYEHERNRTRLM